MQTIKAGNTLQTNSEWFIARIDAVCEPDPNDSCSNYTCSWTQLYFCDNMQKLTEVKQQLVYGDCELGYNVAVPINEQVPEVGAIVLMRQRGATDTFKNIYEFVNASGSTSYGASCCRILDANCQSGLLSVTYSDECIAPTPTPTPSITPSPTASPIPTQTPDPTPVPTGTEPTPSPTMSSTPTPSPSASPEPTPSPTMSPTPTRTLRPTPTPTKTPIPTKSPTPSVTPSPTPTPSPTESPTPSPSVTNSPTPTPEPIPCLTVTSNSGFIATQTQPPANNGWLVTNQTATGFEVIITNTCFTNITIDATNASTTGVFDIYTNTFLWGRLFPGQIKNDNLGFNPSSYVRIVYRSGTFANDQVLVEVKVT